LVRATSVSFRHNEDDTIRLNVVSFVGGTPGGEDGLEARPAIDRRSGQIERHDVRTNRVVLVVAKADRCRADQRSQLLLESLSNQSRLTNGCQPGRQGLQQHRRRT